MSKKRLMYFIFLFGAMRAFGAERTLGNSVSMLYIRDESSPSVLVYPINEPHESLSHEKIRKCESFFYILARIPQAVQHRMLVKRVIEPFYYVEDTPIALEAIASVGDMERIENDILQNNGGLSNTYLAWQQNIQKLQERPCCMNR
jgi:hypothetical protein